MSATKGVLLKEVWDEERKKDERLSMNVWDLHGSLECMLYEKKCKV